MVYLLAYGFYDVTIIYTHIHTRQDSRAYLHPPLLDGLHDLVHLHQLPLAGDEPPLGLGRRGAEHLLCSVVGG